MRGPAPPVPGPGAGAQGRRSGQPGAGGSTELTVQGAAPSSLQEHRKPSSTPPEHAGCGELQGAAPVGTRDTPAPKALSGVPRALCSLQYLRAVRCADTELEACHNACARLKANTSNGVHLL